LESSLTDKQKYPLNPLTQRPMAMYHSWDSQNAWLSQIHTYKHVYMSHELGRQGEFADGDWVWVESMWGKVKGMCRFSESVEPGTIWTWNAIGKATGAWGLDKEANESQRGFLLNHLISEELPENTEGKHISNSDPITGQAAWYDVRVRIYKADDDEPEQTSPQFKAHQYTPGTTRRKPKWQAFFAGLGKFKGDR
jgi:anaerobic selenocysteine-containing dehydrogenase